LDIRKATIADREAIFKIWLSCFTNDETYINNYLKYCFPYTITLLLGDKKQGDISVISILPSYFKHNSITYTGGYLYGVGTLPEFRGRSYSSLLLKEGLELIKKEGYDYFLVKPATESLFSLYRRLGFNKDLFNKNTIIRPKKSHLEKRSIEELSTTDSALFHSIREDKLFNKSFLWPNEVLSYTIREITERGGFLLFDKLTGHYCAGYTSETMPIYKFLKPQLI
jgi:ribosomal protein S18 acetylase RimI-like enzyme